jgi:acetate kinase
MQGSIIVANAGSSSIKFSAYAVTDDQELALRLNGQIEGIGTMPHLIAKDANCGIIAERTWPQEDRPDHEALLGYLMSWMPMKDRSRSDIV